MLNFSPEQVYSYPNPTATQHPHRPIEYSSRGQAVSTSHFRDSAQRLFCVSKTILHVGGQFSSTDVTFQLIFDMFDSTGHGPKTLGGFRFFPQPTDRAEVLHVPSYDIRAA